MLKITNTLSKMKEQLSPQHDAVVTLYVCGVTPYDRAHIGHGRCYVSFDILYRLLTFAGYDVLYCRNITDIDDKLITKAEKEYNDPLRYGDIALHYTKLFHQDMRALGCLSPSKEPKVTESIDLIINFIQSLIDKNHAYSIDGDVYFDLAHWQDYPQLSKHDRHDLIAGARVEIGDKKRNPLDFALWKSEQEGTFFKSPWGWGRPGWHIECSAMAAHHLAPHIDIHGGGEDLMFPHHDNEIAQSEARYGKPFARYWVHNGLVRINKEKMSKSLGNFFTLEDIFKEIDPMALRYYYLTHHYRSPLDFSLDDVHAAAKSYKRMITFFEKYTAVAIDYEQMEAHPILSSVIAYLYDDCNTAAAIGKIWEQMSDLKDSATHEHLKWFIQNILGLSLEPLKEKESVITPEIQALIDARAYARAEKDWKRADELRQQLVDLG